MDSSLWQVVVLAVVQGITEFLPISSDGHLLLVAAWMQGGSAAKETHDLTIVLHLGTLLSILVYYRRQTADLLTRDWRTIGLIVVGTLPAVALGLPLKMTAWGEALLNSTLLAGLMLPVSGIILLLAGRIAPREGTYREMQWLTAFWIGVAQAFALLPGLSRSGSTIAAGLALGLARPQSATFSFLLAIPAIAGAGVLGGVHLARNPQFSTPPWQLAVGAGISFVVGIFALSWLNHWLAQGRLHLFGWYCIAVGLVVLGLEVTRWF
jgi:undecaprenyl-diphosphatase